MSPGSKQLLAAKRPAVAFHRLRKFLIDYAALQSGLKQCFRSHNATAIHEVIIMLGSNQANPKHVYRVPIQSDLQPHPGAGYGCQPGACSIGLLSDTQLQAMNRALMKAALAEQNHAAPGPRRKLKMWVYVLANPDRANFPTESFLPRISYVPPLKGRSVECRTILIHSKPKIGGAREQVFESASESVMSAGGDSRLSQNESKLVKDNLDSVMECHKFSFKIENGTMRCEQSKYSEEVTLQPGSVDQTAAAVSTRTSKIVRDSNDREEITREDTVNGSPEPGVETAYPDNGGGDTVPIPTESFRRLHLTAETALLHKANAVEIDNDAEVLTFDSLSFIYQDEIVGASTKGSRIEKETVSNGDNDDDDDWKEANKENQAGMEYLKGIDNAAATDDSDDETDECIWYQFVKPIDFAYVP